MVTQMQTRKSGHIYTKMILAITSGGGSRLGIEEFREIFVFICILQWECIHVLLVQVKMDFRRMRDTNELIYNTEIDS